MRLQTAEVTYVHTELTDIELGLCRPNLVNVPIVIEFAQFASAHQFQGSGSVFHQLILSLRHRDPGK